MISLPPKAPKGDKRVMNTYNALRAYVMARQVKGVTGTRGRWDIAEYPSGKLVSGHIDGGGGIGACCLGLSCVLLTGVMCDLDGGVFLGENTICDIGSCDFLLGACCEDGVCIITTEGECTGTFCGGSCDDVDCDTGEGCHGGACCDDDICTQTTPDQCDEFCGEGTNCDDIECPCGTGACCNNGDCTTANADDCYDSGGTYQGDGTSCDDAGICDMPPCNCESIAAFDGSGRLFLGLTTIGSFDWSGEGTGCTHAEINYQQDSIVDNDTCVRTTSCFGTGFGSDTGGCTTNITYLSDCSGWTGFGGCPDCDANLDSWLHLLCSPPVVTCENSCSATHCDHSQHWHGNGPATFYKNTYLSDECVPP